jgi:hypothetical protein
MSNTIRNTAAFLVVVVCGFAAMSMFGAVTAGVLGA